MDDLKDKELVRAWRARDVLYGELFGPHCASLPSPYEPPVVDIPDIKSAADIAAILGTTISEKQITVLTYEPNEIRPYWMYVTAGLSNPWFGGGDQNDVSGFGLELVVKTKEKARWPVRLLRRLAYYILSYTGTLHPGVMLTLDTPLLSKRQRGLDSVLIWYLDETPDCVYHLPSGAFGIFLVLGIAESESEFVRSSEKYGCWCMQQVLRNTGHAQITDPDRSSVMDREDIAGMISSLFNYARQFGTADDEPGQAADNAF